MKRREFLALTPAVALPLAPPPQLPEGRLRVYEESVVEELPTTLQPSFPGEALVVVLPSRRPLPFVHRCLRTWAPCVGDLRRALDSAPAGRSPDELLANRIGLARRRWGVVPPEFLFRGPDWPRGLLFPDRPLPPILALVKRHVDRVVWVVKPS